MAACNLSAIKLLVAHGGDIRQNTLLYSTIPPGWPGTTQRLWPYSLESLDWTLGHGTNVDVRATEGQGARRRWRGQLSEAMPLMFAASGDQDEACELLLRHGADFRLRDGAGKTALELAEERGHQDVVVLLERWQRQETEGS